MNDWWGGLEGGLQFFYFIGIVAGVLLVVQLVSLTIGMGDLDLDDFDADIDLISLKTLIAFLFGFGWSGAAAREAGLVYPLSALVAVATGALFLYIVGLLIKALNKLSSGGNRSFESAIGAQGRVYMRVPAEQAGIGQIELTLQGRVEIADAYSKADRALNPNELVTVVGLIDAHSLLVEPVGGPPATSDS